LQGAGADIQVAGDLLQAGRYIVEHEVKRRESCAAGRPEHDCPPGFFGLQMLRYAGDAVNREDLKNQCWQGLRAGNPSVEVV
jgi:hypothetical protein